MKKARKVLRRELREGADSLFRSGVRPKDANLRGNKKEKTIRIFIDSGRKSEQLRKEKNGDDRKNTRKFKFQKGEKKKGLPDCGYRGSSSKAAPFQKSPG